MKISRYITFTLALSLLLGCASEHGVNNTSHSPAVDMAFLVTPGQLMPLTQVTDITGNKRVLNTPGRRKLVILFATWCPDSQRAMKALQASALINDETLDIVAIAREQKVGDVMSWGAENNIKTPLVADESRDIYRQFAHAGIPRFIMVDEQNLIVGTVLAEGEKQLEQIRWH